MTGSDGPYLHHLDYAPGHPQWRAAWGRLQINSGVICADASRHGVDLTVWGGVDQIQFRSAGRAVLVLHGPLTAVTEGQWLMAPVHSDRARWDGWVCAVLLRAHLLAPACTAIASDGTWDAEWADGIGAEVSDAAARRIVDRLLTGSTLAAGYPDPLVTPEQAAGGPDLTGSG